MNRCASRRLASSSLLSWHKSPSKIRSASSSSERRRNNIQHSVCGPGSTRRTGGGGRDRANPPRTLRVLKYRLRGRSDGQLHVHAQVTKTLHQSVGNTFFVALVEVGVAEILIDTAGAQDVENNDQD